MKNFGFIELNDGSCFKSIQVVFEEATLENYKEIAKQNVGAALVVHGTVVLTPEAKQPLEIKADSIEVEGPSAPEYPLQKKRHGVEFLRTMASTCAPGRTCSPPPSACAPWPPLPSMSSSRTGALSMSTPPSSPPRTVRARARCSA